ncbi:hypothetical protein [Kocuria flava]|uniref:Uncharacterized protein n=1 Tax=Kocuria flava TaxID=446860 RepID=A0ABQ0X896_9MICC|nr:hypothetical protein [Kocuria flava]GEO93843.1 hypothetical protein KFL01_31490 [Kocuria flava]
MSKSPAPDRAPWNGSTVPAVRVYVLDGRPVLGLGGLSRTLYPDQARSLAAALNAAADGAEATAEIARTRLRAEAHPTPAGRVRVRIGSNALDLFEDQAFRLADRLADAAEQCRDVLSTGKSSP